LQIPFLDFDGFENLFAAAPEGAETQSHLILIANVVTQASAIFNATA
jgi:hypothetical protein